MSRRRTNHRPGPPRRVLAFEKCEPRLPLATMLDGAIDAGGGQVDVNFLASDFVLVGSTTNLYQTVANHAFDRDALLLSTGDVAAIGSGSVAWQLLHGGAVRRIELGPTLHVPLNVYDATAAAEAATAPGVSDVVRIPPASPAGGEGGTIDLAAVLQPGGPFDRRPDRAALATVDAQAPSSLAQPAGATAPTNVAPIESLRARAVVFRVADADDHSAAVSELLAALADRGVQVIPAETVGPAARGEVPPLATAGHEHQGSTVDETTASDAVWLALKAGSSALDNILSDDAERGAGARPEIAAPADAAFAAWDEDDSPAVAESDAGLVFSANRERSLVAVAVAAVVGTAPVVRRFRRPGTIQPGAITPAAKATLPS